MGIKFAALQSISGNFFKAFYKYLGVEKNKNLFRKNRPFTGGPGDFETRCISLYWIN